MAGICALPLISHHFSSFQYRPPFQSNEVWGSYFALEKTRRKHLPLASSTPPPPEPEVNSEDEGLQEKGGFSLGPVSPYSLCAGIGGVGFLETTYLTYLKLTGSEAFCPIRGDGCSDVLNSMYATVYGVPLPLFGMLAYGFVAFLGLQLSGNNSFLGLDKAALRLVLLGMTTSMATASVYFLYLLSTNLAGATCPYCLFSAALSFTLLFVTLKGFTFQDFQRLFGVQLAVTGLVVAALSNSYNLVSPKLSSPSDFELEPFETLITTHSSPFAISLAKYLHSIDAKMYGAFWCSHCIEQKKMFGQEAMMIVDYIECFPNGAGEGRKMARECSDIGVEGFPTWIIKNEVVSGEQDLQALAEASGFVIKDSIS